MYEYCLNEQDYKRCAREIIFDFEPHTQKLAVKAIEDMFSADNPDIYTWRFIATALKKKSKNNYEKYGFGVWFNKNFYANVFDSMKREDEAESISVRDFLF